MNVLELLMCDIKNITLDEILDTFEHYVVYGVQTEEYIHTICVFNAHNEYICGFDIDINLKTYHREYHSVTSLAHFKEICDTHNFEFVKLTDTPDLHIYKGCWSCAIIHTVEAYTQEFAEEYLVAWAFENKIDNPCHFEMQQIA